MNTKDFLNSVLLELAANASMGAAYPSWDDAFARKEVKEVWLDLDNPMRKPRARQVTVAELQELPLADLLDLGFRRWDETGLLVTPLWMFNYIQDGEALTSIDGTTAKKEAGKIDLDVRGGCIAHGFVHPEAKR